ncbi:unnamed protein product [Caenorhabditis angaria]|uniref:Serpentine Receptor, class H n=1 Tax=Caenorhabditis angaria TaxID=860376 RepID=A0A9P1N8Z0_9PELO|nr:unnamed protein product [Caenorhabditis angaria]
MNNYAPYLNLFKIFTFLCYLDLIFSFPIYSYAIYYMLYRAHRHIRNNYRFFLLSKIIWNCLFENVTSGLATIWFAPIQIACPTGFIGYFGIPSVIWQSILGCLAHALPVSISHLFFYRLKSSIWPSSWYKPHDRFGTLFFYSLYVIGFIFYTKEVIHQGTSQDRLEYAENFTGFPEVFWRDDDFCYISSVKNVTGASHNLPLLLVFTVTTLLLYFMPIATIIIIQKKFKKQNSRNANFQRNLLNSLLVQFSISFLMYTIPSTINQSSFFINWFNPAIVQICQIIVQIHGSFVVVSMFFATSAFKKDLIEDLKIMVKKDYRKKESVIHVTSVCT